jgi:hypothetical protein
MTNQQIVDKLDNIEQLLRTYTWEGKTTLAMLAYGIGQAAEARKEIVDLLNYFGEKAESEGISQAVAKYAISCLPTTEEYYAAEKERINNLGQ